MGEFFGFKEELWIFNLKKNHVKGMDITGKIKEIKYRKAFDINSSLSNSLIFDGQNLFAVSK
jgi:hypothetical protein